MRIDSAATVGDVVNSLIKPEDYLRGIIGKLYDFKKSGPLFVRIGVQGEGKIPNYRIEYEEEGQAYPPPVLGSFKGSNHSPLVDDDDVLMHSNWSTAKSTFEEVTAVLAKIIEKKRGPKPADASQASATGLNSKPKI